MNSGDLSKRTNLYIILSSVFLTNAILAEIIGVKIISLEGVLGMQPLNFELMEGLFLNFNLTAGVIIWPFVFVSTDIINEYYGRAGVKKISYISIILISYIFVILWITTKVPPAAFWQTKNQGFIDVFTQGMNIIIASLVAFLLSQLLDAYTFHYIKKTTGDKKIWLRATGSTVVSQLADSFIVIIIAFYFLLPEGEKWSWSQIFSVAISNYIYKFLVAILMTPLLYLVHFLIDKYLGIDRKSVVNTDGELVN